MDKQRRGLSALIPGAIWEQQHQEETRRLPIAEIARNDYQPRRQKDEEKLAELVESVRLHGVLQPVMVRPVDGGYQLVAGERRLEAASRAGLTEVPVVVRECTEREQLALALVENLQREDLNPIESALAYRRLMEEFDLTQEEVAEQVGRSRPAVANSLRLLNLPSIIQESLLGSKLSEGHARALLMIDDQDRLFEVWREIEQKGLSVRETEALVAKKPKTKNVSRETISQKQLDPNVNDLKMQLEMVLGTKVRVLPRSKGGTLEIEYYNDDDLNHIWELIIGKPADLLSEGNN